MKNILLIAFLFITSAALAQPVNDYFRTAINKESTDCSDKKEYTNVKATVNFKNTGPDVWFRFKASLHDVTIMVAGGGNGGIRAPHVELFSDTTGSILLGSTVSGNDVTTFSVGGLIIDKYYYIQVSSAGNNTGIFSLCINSYVSPPLPGQDYVTASALCSKATFTQQRLRGGGNNNDEAAGTCLEIPNKTSEQNSVWYKWTAANNGTLIFNIIPLLNDNDIDWVLYDLGTTDDPANINAQHVKRCAAGSGVTNYIDFPAEDTYSQTGMNFTETDLSEEGGYGKRQNGFVKYLDMEQGHVYALLINNFTEVPLDNNSIVNNGFKIIFGGTGEFVGPKAMMDFTEKQPCTPSQNFTFNGSSSTDYSALKWTFGDDASIPSATGTGPFTITYSVPGTKTVVLEAYSASGCYTVDVKTFEVGVTPQKPVITANKLAFCLNETLTLSTPALPYTTYRWTGPDNFVSDQATVNILLKTPVAAGTYTLAAMQGNCISDAATITIPTILSSPVAAFRTLPTLPAKLSAPVSITFFNQSINADHYQWAFGDGATSTEENPVHEYTAIGSYDVILIAFRSNVCSVSVIKGKFVITADNTLFIPNTFTPNGDNVNDEFAVNISNLQSYHIRIYNRWGVQVFESVDIFDNWKGTFNGQPLPAGVYYYVIEGSSITRIPVKRSGYITLIR